MPAAIAAHDLAPHRKDAVLPHVVGESHDRIAARVVIVQRQTASHERLHRRVVEDHVVGRQTLLADQLDHVFATIGQLGSELCSLRFTPARVQPVVSHRERLDFAVATRGGLELHQPALEETQVHAARAHQLL